MSDIRESVHEALRRARERTHVLTDSVDDADLTAQHSPLMSPLVWDLVHIGNQEDLWLVREVGERSAVRSDIDELYDAFRHARADRPGLPLLDPADARAYVRTVREKTWEVLDSTDFSGGPLDERGFVFGMIAQHEQQHAETMLATHKLREGDPVLSAPTAPWIGGQVATDEVLVPGGEFTMGTSDEPWALDNERPAHTVDIPAFAIDTTPVTNEQYLAFMADGGYERPELWSERGWEHRREAGLVAPLFWENDGCGTWWRRRFSVMEPVHLQEPVVHVCYFEAQAYAKWAKKRLPTEAEWEKAARWDPASNRSYRYPWGDADPDEGAANLGQRFLGPAVVGSYQAGVSALGVHQLIGDVWEWTSSPFEQYPGFVAFPYREYSEVFFGGDYRVLRGGSFGTDHAACRGSFRNWDHPVRRQIFSGFRCARDVSGDEF